VYTLSRDEEKMPNQRDIRKKKIGVWLTPEEIAQLDKYAASIGIDRTELIRRIAKGETDEKGNHNQHGRSRG